MGLNKRIRIVVGFGLVFGVLSTLAIQTQLVSASDPAVIEAAKKDGELGCLSQQGWIAVFNRSPERPGDLGKPDRNLGDL